jgi:hypothetical protein
MISIWNHFNLMRRDCFAGERRRATAGRHALHGRSRSARRGCFVNRSICATL